MAKLTKQETKTLMLLLEDMEDPRRGNGIRHKLQDIILIGILAMVSNMDTFTQMEAFGKYHEEELRQYLDLPHGIPSHDTFGDVFSMLDPRQLSLCFASWIEQLRERVEQSPLVAIDGKTIRRSGRKERSALHVVTAFASETQLVLGELATEEKSNEITAIPQLLELFEVKGKIITIDAMGTQTAIAEKIINAGGDYVLALKQNHPSLLEDVSYYLDQEVLSQTKKALSTQGLYDITLEKGHGRVEKRECYVCHDTSWLPSMGHHWAGIAGFGVILSTVTRGTKETKQRHYFITSVHQASATQMLHIKRKHWAIENQLHWFLDVFLREDDCRARLEHAAINLNILRKLVLQLMKSETSVKASMVMKRSLCAMNINYAYKVIGLDFS